MLNCEIINHGLELVLQQKKAQHRLTGWFEYQENKRRIRDEFQSRGLDPDAPENSGKLLCRCVETMKLEILRGSIFAGSQDDAFSPSYALINPAFMVESFAGYCDPVAIYDDLEPSGEFPRERIEALRDYYRNTPYVRELQQIYRESADLTGEVAFFMEPVTGHMIPDMRKVLKYGLKTLIDGFTGDSAFAGAMRDAACAAGILARRYAALAETMSGKTTDREEQLRLQFIAANCRRVPEQPAENLAQAIQSYLLMWQIMCLEQAPNPYAFSAGNLDRVFQDHLGDCPFEDAVGCFRHLLAFFMVGARGWAISQNILLGGRDPDGNDLTLPMTGIILEAFFRSNAPQPALSVKIHRNTPDELYRDLGRFFFTAGHSTASCFNDDMMFDLLKAKGIEPGDIPDWSVAGCQEPLIMGKENGNTTNSWLNLAKVLELTLNDGRSLLSGRKIALGYQELGYSGISGLFADLETAFFRQLDYILPAMEKAANACTGAIGKWATPFGSLLFGGLESGRDMRDAAEPGVRYCTSGCLIHGLSVVTDSLIAVKHYLSLHPGAENELIKALAEDFKNSQNLRWELLSYPKYGTGNPEPDQLACRLVSKVSGKVAALRNNSGNPFTPDYSTPSTHLLYGYWVGATPDGRTARSMLGYGIDPRPECAATSLTDQLISQKKLPFEAMPGGYASHIGLNPELFAGSSDKSLAMRDRVIAPLFKESKTGKAPFYVYFNIDSAAHLRKILSDPQKHVPSGIYIMRIHGTFVNFLDLAPAIQEDIIKRLERSESA